MQNIGSPKPRFRKTRPFREGKISPNVSDRSFFMALRAGCLFQTACFFSRIWRAWPKFLAGRPQGYPAKTCNICENSCDSKIKLSENAVLPRAGPSNGCAMVFSLRSCRSLSVKLGGNLAGFFRAHKIKAQKSQKISEHFFVRKFVPRKKIFRANFVLQMCHPKNGCAMLE